jgi:hypothetical protein
MAYVVIRGPALARLSAGRPRRLPFARSACPRETCPLRGFCTEACPLREFSLVRQFMPCRRPPLRQKSDTRHPNPWSLDFGVAKKIECTSVYSGIMRHKRILFRSQPGAGFFVVTKRGHVTAVGCNKSRPSSTLEILCVHMIRLASHTEAVVHKRLVVNTPNPIVPQMSQIAARSR